MSATAMIVLGILVWILLAIGLALFTGRMVRLRDRQVPHSDDVPPERLDDQVGTYSHTPPHPQRQGDGE
jgi:hypothetical protein